MLNTKNAGGTVNIATAHHARFMIAARSPIAPTQINAVPAQDSAAAR